MLELFDADDDILEFMVDEGLESILGEVFQESTGASKKQKEASAKNLRKMAGDLDVESAKAETILEEIDKQILGYILEQGSFTSDEDDNQFSGRSFNLANTRSTG